MPPPLTVGEMPAVPKAPSPTRRCGGELSGGGAGGGSGAGGGGAFAATGGGGAGETSAAGGTTERRWVDRQRHRQLEARRQLETVARDREEFTLADRLAFTVVHDHEPANAFRSAAMVVVMATSASRGTNGSKPQTR